MALFAPCQIASLSYLGSRDKNVVALLPSCEYGRIVTPAIMRRLVGWYLPYFSSRPILVGVVICLHPYWCLLFFFPAVRYYLSGGFCLYRLCRSFARKKKRIYTKNAKIVCYLCYQWLKGLPVVAFVVTKHIS